MSADLERWMFGNPESVLLRKESSTCKGCVHLEAVKAFDKWFVVCNKKKKPGNRCRLYKEAE